MIRSDSNWNRCVSYEWHRTIVSEARAISSQDAGRNLLEQVRNLKPKILSDYKGMTLDTTAPDPPLSNVNPENADSMPCDDDMPAEVKHLYRCEIKSLEDIHTSKLILMIYYLDLVVSAYSQLHSRFMLEPAKYRCLHRD